MPEIFAQYETHDGKEVTVFKREDGIAFELEVDCTLFKIVFP